MQQRGTAEAEEGGKLMAKPGDKQRKLKKNAQREKVDRHWEEKTLEVSVEVTYDKPLKKSLRKNISMRVWLSLN